MRAEEIRKSIKTTDYIYIRHDSGVYCLMCNGVKLTAFDTHKEVINTINKARRMRLGLGGPESFTESNDLINGLNEAVNNGENPFAGSLITDGKLINN
jgi:hypothetical protein